MDPERHQDPINLLIVDDHGIIRRGLREVVKQYWRVGVIEEATSCAEIIPALERSRTDLLLLDLHLGDGNAIDLLDSLHDRFPQVNVLVYSMSAERVFAQQALARGARGFLSKTTDERELVCAIDRVLGGGIYMSPELERVARQRKHDRPGAAIEDPFNDLSDRELRVMDELLTGAGVKEIASRLELQPTTIATYNARLFDKLGVSNLIDLHSLISTRRPTPVDKGPRSPLL